MDFGSVKQMTVTDAGVTKTVAALTVGGKTVKFAPYVTFANTTYYDTSYTAIGTTRYSSYSSVSLPASGYVDLGTVLGAKSATAVFNNPVYMAASSSWGTQSFSLTVDGWYSDDALTTAFDVTSTPVTGDITLYPKWKMTADYNETRVLLYGVVPKFMSSVYWKCYSRGGNRTAIDVTSSSSRYSCAICMASPGADRNMVEKTWTTVKGLNFALTSLSFTIGSDTSSVANGTDGGTWSQKFRVLDYMPLYNNGIHAGSKTFSSGLYKATISWPAQSGTTSVNVSITFYYNNNQVGYYTTLCSIFLGRDKDNDYVWPDGFSSQGSKRSDSFTSGNYGASGAYGVSTVSNGSEHHASVDAASGTGYDRKVTFKA